MKNRILLIGTELTAQDHRIISVAFGFTSISAYLPSACLVCAISFEKNSANRRVLANLSQFSIYLIVSIVCERNQAILWQRVSEFMLNSNFVLLYDFSTSRSP